MPVEIQQNVIDALTRLRGKDAEKVINMALNESVRILRKETVSVFKKNAVTKSGKKINMKTAGLVRTSRRMRGQLLRKVHIMGLPLARIFENGTDERHTFVRKKVRTARVTDSAGKRYRITIGTGKGRRTGRILPIRFFKTARENKEQEIYSTFNNNLLKDFEKLWKAGKIRKK